MNEKAAQENYVDISVEEIVARLREVFREEAYELLSELEAALLELEKTPDDMELVGRVFRSLHTIKGSGASCEFKDVSAFAHEIETFFDMIRKGQLRVTKEITDMTLVSIDQLRAMLDAYYKGGVADPGRCEEILSSFEKIGPAPALKETGHRVKSAEDPAGKADLCGERTSKNVTYRIRFRPSQDVITRGADPALMLDDLRKLGTCKVVAQTADIPYLEDLKPDACYTYWDVILTTNKGIDAIRDVFIFAKENRDLKIEVIDEEGRLDDEVSYKNLGDILLERGDLTHEDLESVLREKKRLGELLVETGVVSGDKVESALVEQQHVRETRERRVGSDSFTSIRVATGKLDGLVDLVGELVTVQARLSRTVFDQGGPELLSIAEEVERLTNDLRDRTMSIRMLPIGTTFSMFRRVVRDLSRELGKEAELETEGADTELDKTVIERLNDPLVHIIRNSIDHGIEQPDVRASAGKPRHGKVRLSAAHSGAHVLIQIRDDGAGLDRAAIRAKAIEKGIIQPEAELTDREIYNHILAPGFSTARNVTSVSGRGVGLDVVKKTIDALRGSIEIGSQSGAGTTITLKLPLTLAIIEGLLVRIGGEHFVMPLSFVKECVELMRSESGNGDGRAIADVRGEITPFIRLRDQFGIHGSVPEIQQIVITETNGGRIGFVVDTVIGSHQTVIKNLGRFYREVEGVSGATILGDGTVALILDVPKLVQCAERNEAMTASAGGHQDCRRPASPADST